VIIRVSLSLALSFLLGFSFLAYGMVHSTAIFNFISLLLIGAYLTFIFLTLVFKIALSNENKIKGLGYAILMWSFLAIIYEGLFLNFLIVFQEYSLD
jgi:Cu-processing system permease protein